MKMTVSLTAGLFSGAILVAYMLWFKKIVTNKQTDNLMKKVFILLAIKIILATGLCFLAIKVFSLQARPFVLALGGIYLLWLMVTFLIEVKKTKKMLLNQQEYRKGQGI